MINKITPLIVPALKDTIWWSVGITIYLIANLYMGHSGNIEFSNIRPEAFIIWGIIIGGGFLFNLAHNHILANVITQRESVDLPPSKFGDISYTILGSGIIGAILFILLVIVLNKFGLVD
jgi:hypothetical protein